MSRNLKAAIVGIAIALVVGLAVNYGLISQQTADEIKAKTDEVLTNEGTPSSPDQSSPPAQQTTTQVPDGSPTEPTQAPEEQSRPPDSTDSQGSAQPSPAN